LYADPFDVEAQKKIEAAIRQVGITFSGVRTTHIGYVNVSFFHMSLEKNITYDEYHYMHI